MSFEFRFENSAPFQNSQQSIPSVQFPSFGSNSKPTSPSFFGFSASDFHNSTNFNVNNTHTDLFGNVNNNFNQNNFNQNNFNQNNFNQNNFNQNNFNQNNFNQNNLHNKNANNFNVNNTDTGLFGSVNNNFNHNYNNNPSSDKTFQFQFNNSQERKEQKNHTHGFNFTYQNQPFQFGGFQSPSSQTTRLENFASFQKPFLSRSFFSQEQSRKIKGTNEHGSNMVTLECPICLDFPSEVTSTFCGHVFCFGCIQDHINSKGNCPICNMSLSPQAIHRLYLF